MADTYYSVQIKRGTKAELDSVPDLFEGELAWITDESEIYIGTPSGNKKVTHKTELGSLDFSGVFQGSDITSIILEQKTTIDDLKELISNMTSGFSSIPTLVTDAYNNVSTGPGLVYFDSNSTTTYPDGFIVR